MAYDRMILTPDGKPMFISNAITPIPGGKATFVGHNEPPITNVKGESTKIPCPICKIPVDYLVGENTEDGGIQGCEGCWKPSKKKGGNYERSIPNSDSSPISAREGKEIPFG